MRLWRLSRLEFGNYVWHPATQQVRCLLVPQQPIDLWLQAFDCNEHQIGFLSEEALSIVNAFDPPGCFPSSPNHPAFQKQHRTDGICPCLPDSMRRNRLAHCVELADADGWIDQPLVEDKHFQICFIVIDVEVPILKKGLAFLAKLARLSFLPTSAGTVSHVADTFSGTFFGRAFSSAATVAC